MTTSYNTEYKTATLSAIEAVVPPVLTWGPASNAELAAAHDAAAMYDGAGCDMPEGGLSAAAEWAFDFRVWMS